MPEEARSQLISALFAATWGGGPGVTDPVVLEGLLTSAWLDGAALLAAAGSSAAKERLRQNTEEALAAGAFGVPTVLIGEELFWGLDAFPDIADHLSGADPVSPGLLARWEGLAASADRRR